MKKSIKLTLLIAVALILLGGITVGIALALGGRFDVEHHVATYTIEEAFDSVLISVNEADVRILPSEDGTSYAVCDETDRISYRLSVSDRGVLTLSLADERRWYDHLGISMGNASSVTLYLPPEVRYSVITVLSDSGDIICTDPSLSFGTVALSTSSGDIRYATPSPLALGAFTSGGSIELSDIQAGTMTLGTASGDIELRRVAVKRDLSATAASGDISFSECTATALTISAESGEVDLRDTIAEQTISVKTTSGDITLDRCDAAELTLTAESGGIEGTLLSGKLFDVQTSSGRRNCPPSVRDGGSCAVRTKSGDIDIQIAA